MTWVRYLALLTYKNETIDASEWTDDSRKGVDGGFRFPTSSHFIFLYLFLFFKIPL
nr:MAG TPA: hypothetical protein [Caudoviricetes sp.]